MLFKVTTFFISCLLFFLTLHDELKFNLLNTSPLNNIDTIFEAKNIALFLTEDKSQKYTLRASKTKFYLKNKQHEAHFFGKVYFNKNEDGKDLYIYSSTMKLNWSSKGSNEIGTDSLAHILFDKNVLVDKENFFLKTKTMKYNKEKNHLLGNEKAYLFSNKALVESKNGFIWDLEDDKISLKGKIDGVTKI